MDFFKVKITQPGWETFSGDYVGYPFENGESTVAIPRSIVDRISALVPCEIFNADGENLGQGGAAARIATRRSLEATVGTALERQSDDAKAAELLQVHQDSGKPPTREFYTEAQLTGIADAGGIDELRKLAVPWNVKHRSIPGLINLIVKAQNNFIRVKEQREIDERNARAAAMDEAVAKRLAEEAEAMKACRVLTTDETPNAVDADGKPVHVKTEPPKNELTIAEKQAIEQAGAENSAANEAASKEQD